jgi:hypothetical protein
MPCVHSGTKAFSMFTFSFKHYCHDFGLTIEGFRIDDLIYWTFTDVTTNNYDRLTELHIPEITVTTARIKSSQFPTPSAVAW